jgi:hypothetical protein
MKHMIAVFARRAAIALPIVFALAASPTPGLAQDNPVLGTWKFVPEKSTASPGSLPYESMTLKFSVSGEGLRGDADGVDADGDPIKGIFTIVADGKYYPVTGMPEFNSSSYIRVSDRNTVYIRQRNGTTVIAGSRIVSDDGNALVFREKAVDNLGRETGNALLVFEKQ